MRSLAYAAIGLGALWLYQGNAADRAVGGTRQVPLVSPLGAALVAGGVVLFGGRPLLAAGAALAGYLLADRVNARENARILAEPGEWYDAEGNVLP